MLFLVQKRSVEGAKQGMPGKKLKKEKAASATGKAGRSEANNVPMAPRVKPELILPVMYFLEALCSFYFSLDEAYELKVWLTWSVGDWL